MTSSMVAPALVWPGFRLEAAGTDKRTKRRLRRAAYAAAPDRRALALAASALGIEMPPAAPLARLGDGLAPGEGGWLRAEPVMLMPDRDRLVLMRLDEDPLSDDEARALLASTRAHFEERELYLERTGAGHWYALAPGVAPVPDLPPELAAGGGVNAALGGAGAASPRERLLNEIQMLWHAHPVNAERRAAGRIQANALWLWGGGALPTTPRVSLPGGVVASGAQWRGLAVWLGCAHAPLSGPDATAADGAALIVVGPDQDDAGRAWLEDLARRRSGFSVWAGSGVWRVSRRFFPRW